MITTIFFDAAGTLFHLPRGVGWHYRDVAHRHGCDLSEEALGRAFGAVWREMPPRESTRRSRESQDREWWRQLVHRVLDRCGVGEAELNRHAYFEELFAEFTQPGVWILYPEVSDVLGLLAQRYRLGIISNFDARLNPILQALGIADYFDPIIVSSEVGAEKPDPWIFQEALRLARCAPSAALHVGDDPVRDWQGAAASGLEVFRLERPRNSLRAIVAQLTYPYAS